MRQIVEAEHALDDEQLVAGDFELLRHELAQVLGHGGLDFEPDDAAAPALLQRRLEQPHEILGLFLDFEVAVADDAETALPLHVVAGEEPAGVEHDHLLERDEAGRAGLGEIRQADEALDLVRQADQRVQHLAVALPRQFQRDRSAEIGDERKRMGRDRPRAASAPGRRG